MRLHLVLMAALAIVVLFEQTGGFGVMSNTYDPLDNAANAAGIALAVLLDALTAPLIRPAARRPSA